MSDIIRQVGKALSCLLQNSFFKLMMGDNKSEKFFKVLNDRMKEAQTDIKATVSVNVGEMTQKANGTELEHGETFTSCPLTPELPVFR